MASGFLQWWIRNLRETLPERLRQVRIDRNALIAEYLESGQVTLTTRRNGEKVEVKNFGTDRHGISALHAELATRPAGERLILRVDARGVLERDITLPISQEQDVDGLLQFEMDRFTSFQADELIWTSKVTACDRKRNRLFIRLTIVPRFLIKSALEYLSAAGSIPIALEARAPDGIRVIPLARGEAVHLSGAPPVRKIKLVSIFLVLMILSEPILRQMVYIQYLQYRRDTIAPNIKAIDLLLQRASDRDHDARAVGRERDRVGNVLEALAVVSEVLPDDTYLTQFTMRDRKVTLVGVSDSAPRLIGLLAADSRIGNPAFTTAITRQPSGIQDKYSKSSETERDVYAIQAEMLDR